MKNIFSLFCLLVISFAGKAQQTYCTNLYFDGLTCKVRPSGTITNSHLGIRDFILQGHGSSRIFDTGTSCGPAQGPNFSPGYSDRTFIAPVNLRRDSTYTITVKQEDLYDSAGIIKRYFWHATWVAIDFNNNFAFDSAAADSEFIIVRDMPNVATSYERHVYDPNGVNGLSYPVTLSFRIKIPANASYGTHRLRIRTLGSYGAGGVDPCYKSGLGETQDYLVKIVQVPASVGSLATNADRFALAPNPATATTALQIPAGSAAIEAQIMDVQGRLCATQKGAAGTTTLSFDTDALPAGLYFVRVTEAGQQPVILKLVK